MEEVSHLIIKVSSEQAETATHRLIGLDGASRGVDKSMGIMSSASAKAMAVIGALAAAAAVAYKGLGKIVEVTGEYETLTGRLRTVAESGEEARQMFDAIEQLSVDLPTSLEDTTAAFLRLAQQGLDPSRKALEAYANIAVATGSSLESVADTVVSAANGQYRSLQQLGIKAIQEQDGLTLVFRGNAEKIKGDAKSIEEYLQRIGNVQFAGAAAAQAGTMADVIDDLDAAWFRLWKSISETGIGDLIKEGIVLATDAIQELTDMIASGQLVGYIDAIASKFASWAEAGKAVADYLMGLFGSLFSDVGEGAWSMVSTVLDSLLYLPENVAAVVKGIGATLGLIVEYGVAVGKGLYSAVTGYMRLLWDSVKNLGKELYDQIANPFSAGTFDFVDSQKAAVSSFGKEVSSAWDQSSQSINNATEAWEGVVTEIMDERDATIKATKDKFAAADQLRQKYDELAAAKKNSEADPLKKGQQSRGDTSASEEQRRNFEQVRNSLLSEEVLVEESYRKRRQIIIDNTIAGSDEQIELLRSLEERRAVELDAAYEATAERIERQYLAEQNQLQAQYDSRLITEAQFMERSKQNWQNYSNAVSTISVNGARIIAIKQMETQAQVLQMASGIADQMSNLVQGNNDAAKAMFIVSKAIAIAQAIVNTELAATKALAEGGIYAGIPMSTLIRATGYASVALMTATAAQEYAGKFEHGGMIGAGRYGLVGETGVPELVEGPAIVRSARQTTDLLANNNRSTEPKTTVIVNNYTDAQADVQEREDTTGRVIEITVKRVKNELTSEVNTGGSQFSRALEQRYNLKRTG